MPISDHAQPKFIEITFSFPGFAPACKKTLSFISSLLRYGQFLIYSPFLNFLRSSPETKLAKLIFDHALPKTCQSTFNFCEFVSTCKKSGYFIDLFWRYGWLKYPAIWLAENILAHISGTKIFPNTGFLQNHTK